jgi:hypothetical protein
MEKVIYAYHKSSFRKDEKFVLARQRTLRFWRNDFKAQRKARAVMYKRYLSERYLSGRAFL